MSRDGRARAQVGARATVAHDGHNARETDMMTKAQLRAFADSLSETIAEEGDPTGLLLQACAEARRKAARKRTKFQTCDTHCWLDGETRYRRAEYFMEGGPAFGGPCVGDGCRIWPGLDLFVVDICADMAEYPVEWAVNRRERAAA